MKVSAIVAAAKNRVIGNNNQIPWYLPADFKYFKKTTLDHCVIMGRNCYESIGKPLPKRTNIIVTRDPFYLVTGCLTAHSIEEALGIAFDTGETEAFIIGGGQIYEQTIDYLDRIYYTEVDLEPEGDVFFPQIDHTEWAEVSREHHSKDEKNDHDFSFIVYDRINSTDEEE